MSKPKIQPLTTLILSRSQILISLSLAHRIPDGSSLLVPPHIVVLRQNNGHDIPRNQSQQDLVARAVEGFIFGAVDLEGVSGM
jgi:hypothetical protein